MTDWAASQGKTMRYQQLHSPPPSPISARMKRARGRATPLNKQFYRRAHPCGKETVCETIPEYSFEPRTLRPRCARSLWVNFPMNENSWGLVWAASPPPLPYLTLRSILLLPQSRSAPPPTHPSQSACNVDCKMDVKDCRLDIRRKYHIEDIAQILSS